MNIKKISRAFTLAEVMIVVVIIGIMATALSNFDFNKSTEEEKATRIANKIKSLLKTEITNSLIGKGIQYSTGITMPTGRDILIGKSNGINIKYILTPASTQTGEVFKKNFFDEPSYSINTIEVQGLNGSTGAIVDPYYIKLKNGIINFSGSTSPSISNPIKMNIRAGYNDTYKNIELDKRTGTIEIKK